MIIPAAYGSGGGQNIPSQRERKRDDCEIAGYKGTRTRTTNRESGQCKCRSCLSVLVRGFILDFRQKRGREGEILWQGFTSPAQSRVNIHFGVNYTGRAAASQPAPPLLYRLQAIETIRCPSCDDDGDALMAPPDNNYMRRTI